MVDGIESTRALGFFGGNGPIWLSPDGSRYLVALARGDLQRDGVWVEFFTGRTDSLDSAQPRNVARLFTRGLGNPPITQVNRLVWLNDNEHVAFLWDEHSSTPELVMLNVDTGQLKSLVRRSAGVNGFAVSPKDRAVLYTAFAARDDAKALQLRREGFAVMDASVYTLLDGAVDGWQKWDHIELFFSAGPESPSRKVRLPNLFGAGYSSLMEIAPDGRHALIAMPAGRIPLEWDRYTEQALKTIWLPSARSNGDESRVIAQIYVVDLKAGTCRSLWNAPVWDFRTKVVWSPDGRSVVIGSTFLPVGQSDELGLEGRAVAEVDLISGRFAQLPTPPERERREFYAPLSWTGNSVELYSLWDRDLRLRFEKEGDHWRQVLGNSTTVRKSSAPIRVELREDVNSPPVLYAVESSSGQNRMLLDLNPQLRTDFTLGRVEIVRWTDKKKRAWSGRLYYPVGFAPGKRFPLVIQTSSTKDPATPFFSLIGDEEMISVYAAQPLANRGIAVLHMDNPDAASPIVWGAPNEAKDFQAGYESAAEYLVGRGLVDRNKVGLTGFSRTGWRVEYALTHSDFPFAAAIAADNFDASYVQGILNGAPASGAAENGGAPFGEGLEAWLEEAPGFNAHRVITPLRLQVNSGGIVAALSQWEMFSRLRYLGKPVELYVAPNIEQGTHNLVNPRQVLATQSGVIEWYDFWLNGREDDDPAKAAQFDRWRHMRGQRDAVLAQPRLPQLKWQATPWQAN